MTGKRILPPWLLWTALLAELGMGMIRWIEVGRGRPPGLMEQLIQKEMSRWT